MEVWWPGNAPMGVWFHEYSDADKEARQCFGEQRFFYRAEILDGDVHIAKRKRRQVNASTPAPTAARVVDWQWLSRDEIRDAGIITDAAFAEHLHSIAGFGMGEEYARERKAQGLPYFRDDDEDDTLPTADELLWAADLIKEIQGPDQDDS